MEHARFTGESGMRFWMRSSDSPRHPRVYVSWVETEIRLMKGSLSSEDPFLRSFVGILDGLRHLWGEVWSSVGRIRSARGYGEGECPGLVEQYCSRKLEISILRAEIAGGGAVLEGWDGNVSEWYLDEMLLQRLSLQQNPLVKRAISHFWLAACKGRPDLSKNEYVRWSHKASRALLQHINFDEERYDFGPQ